MIPSARRLGAVVRELWAGIHAANAIRHGLPVPDGARVSVDPPCPDTAAAQAASGGGPRDDRTLGDRGFAFRGVVPFH